MKILWIIHWSIEKNVSSVFNILTVRRRVRKGERTLGSTSNVPFLLCSKNLSATYLTQPNRTPRPHLKYRRTRHEHGVCFQNNANLRNIDSACRNVLPDLRHFVCMQSDAAEVCESRSSANANCVNVQCSKSVHKPEAVLKHMKKLIESAEDSRPVSVVVGDTSDHGQ